MRCWLAAPRDWAGTATAASNAASPTSCPTPVAIVTVHFARAKPPTNGSNGSNHSLAWSDFHRLLAMYGLTLSPSQKASPFCPTLGSGSCPRPAAYMCLLGGAIGLLLAHRL